MSELEPIPQIDSEKIRPEGAIPEKTLNRPEPQRSQEIARIRRERAERREASEVYRKILQWWRGDAHSHSEKSTREGFGYAEGIYDVREMIKYYDGLGLEFVCFAEHASKPGEPKKQAPDSQICQSLLAEAEKITRINHESKGGVVALSGVETNIIFDENGQPILDIPTEVLQQLDLVIASRHTIAREKEPKAIKESLLYSVGNPDIDVIGHPDRYTRRGGEQPQEYWDEYWAAWREILEDMVKNDKAFEININSPPHKKLVEMAAEAGVKFFINYDAHDFGQYKKVQTEVIKAGEEAKQRWAKGEQLPDDSGTLASYKEQRLTAGPGVGAIKTLIDWIGYLESLGVTPDRVVNSSRKRLLEFLRSHGKKTADLEYLYKRYL